MPKKNNTATSRPDGFSVVYGLLKAPAAPIIPTGKSNEQGLYRSIHGKDQHGGSGEALLTSRAGKVALHPRDLRRVDQAVAYIEKKYADHISPEALSIEVGLSVLKLQAGLHLQTGCSVYTYQEQVRIRVARTLLEDSDKPLKCIARAAGFKTHSHFGEVFRKIVGQTPSAYRNQFGR